MIQIAAFSSSPRADSNSRFLMHRVLRASADAGAVIHDVDLNDRTIAPCTQCDHCCQTGCCVIRDDMDAVYELVEDCDVFVLASPIYFMAHNAQAKIMLDRFQMFWARKHILKQPAPTGKYGIHIAVGATHGPAVFAGVRTTMKWVFRSIGVSNSDELFVEGCDAPGSVRTQADALQRADALGMSLAEKIRMG